MTLFDLWLYGVAALVLFILSSCFAAAETALTAFSRPRIYRLAKRGHARAKTIATLSRNMNHVIGTMLIGNNIMDILATSLATILFIKLLSDTGVVIATGLMTLFIIIFLQVMPKMYAMAHAENLVLIGAPIINIVIKTLNPLMHFVQWIAEKIFTLFRQTLAKQDGWSAALEELRSTIDLHGQGALQKESAMLHSILDLSTVKVKEIMIHRSDVEMIDVDMPFPKIYNQILKSPFSRIPIWEGNPENIIGIVHIKKLLIESEKAKESGRAIDIKKIAVKPWFVPESTPLLHQMQAFKARRHHLAIVIDEYGAYSGIVTLEDILEEIVGKIDDEYDVENIDIQPENDGNYLVKGTVTIRDFNRHFHLEIPDEEFSTIAGLLIFESHHIPNVGEMYRFYGLTFTILRRENNQVTLVRVSLPE